jgi:hypothetical protein
MGLYVLDVAISQAGVAGLAAGRAVASGSHDQLLQLLLR